MLRRREGWTLWIDEISTLTENGKNGEIQSTKMTTTNGGV